LYKQRFWRRHCGQQRGYNIHCIFLVAFCIQDLRTEAFVMPCSSTSSSVIEEQTAEDMMDGSESEEGSGKS
jgi:hypothetical protein